MGYAIIIPTLNVGSSRLGKLGNILKPLTSITITYTKSGNAYTFSGAKVPSDTTETAAITFSISKGDADGTISNSNKTFTCSKSGTITVTATCNGMSFSQSFNVTYTATTIVATGVTINNLTSAGTDRYTLSATFTPSGCAPPSGITWSITSGADVASLSGTTLTVLKTGSVTVKVQTTSPSLNATKTFSVTKSGSSQKTWKDITGTSQTKAYSSTGEVYDPATTEGSISYTFRFFQVEKGDVVKFRADYCSTYGNTINGWDSKLPKYNGYYVNACLCSSIPTTVSNTTSTNVITIYNQANKNSSETYKSEEVTITADGYIMLRCTKNATSDTTWYCRRYE